MSLAREMHKERITKQKKYLEILSIHKSNNSMNGSKMLNLHNDLDSDIQLLDVKEKLDKYIQEAIDDGYPELAI